MTTTTKPSAPPANAPKPPSQRSVPPSTRQFVKDYAAFHAQEPTDLNAKALEQAKALKRGGTDSSGSKPDTRQFMKAYKAFYDVGDISDQAMMDQARAIKNGGAQGGS